MTVHSAGGEPGRTASESREPVEGESRGQEGLDVEKRQTEGKGQSECIEWMHVGMREKENKERDLVATNQKKNTAI